MAIGYLDFTTKHAVAESTDILGTHWGEHIYNIKIGNVARDNGVVVTLGAYDSDDIYLEGAAPAASAFTGEILEQAANGGYVIRVTKSSDGVALILSVPKTYYEFETAATEESQFYNGVGEIARGYQLRYGDRFTISAEGFTTTPTSASIGKAVTVDATTKKLVIGS